MDAITDGRLVAGLGRRLHSLTNNQTPLNAQRLRVAKRLRGGLARFAEPFIKAMIPEPYELFDIDKTSDKLFLIGTSWVVLFLMLL